MTWRCERQGKAHGGLQECDGDVLTDTAPREGEVDQRGPPHGYILMSYWCNLCT